MSEPTYIEQWKVSGNPQGDIIEITYTMDPCIDYRALDVLREFMAKAHNCTLECLLKLDVVEQETWEGE